MSEQTNLISASSDLPCAPAVADEFLSRPAQASVMAIQARRGPIMVLGAGGKMGLQLCMMLKQCLTQAGRTDDLIAVSRFSTLRERSEFERRGITVITCDLEDETQLAMLPDAPTIFFLAGVKVGTSTDVGLLHRLNVEMPRRVAARFRQSAFVAFSTGCVYPFVTPQSGGATESTPPTPVGEYAISCRERENAFIDASVRFGTPSVLIRLNYSVEFRYGLLVDIALRVWRREPIDVTTGHVNVIWQTDALNYAIQSLALMQAPSAVLNVTGPGVIRVRDVALRFGELLKRPVEITGTEAETDWLNNATKAHARFGPPATPLNSMMGWIAAWITAGGKLWDRPTAYERRDGRF